MSAPKLMRCLVAPSRIVSILDWKTTGSVVLGLDISDASIGVSYANHPSPTNEVHILDTIPYVAVDNKCGLERLKQKARVADALDDIVNDLKVRAFVVGLPLQPDGRMGGPCGKVLHFLDYLAEREKPIISKARPLALWDERDIPRNVLEQRMIMGRKKTHAVDKWGRSPSFCHVPSKVPGNYVYKSRHQFFHVTRADSAGASLILKHFLDTHWEPEKDDDDQMNSVIEYSQDDELGITHQIENSSLEAENAFLSPSML